MSPIGSVIEIAEDKAVCVPDGAAVRQLCRSVAEARGFPDKMSPWEQSTLNHKEGY